MNDVLFHRCSPDFTVLDWAHRERSVVPRLRQGRDPVNVTKVRDGEGAMPHYNFLCRACEKKFSKVLTLAEYEKGGVVCPHCKGNDVQQRWATFYAVTSKKS